MEDMYLKGIREHRGKEGQKMQQRKGNIWVGTSGMSRSLTKKEVRKWQLGQKEQKFWVREELRSACWDAYEAKVQKSTSPGWVGGLRTAKGLEKTLLKIKTIK